MVEGCTKNKSLYRKAKYEIGRPLGITTQVHKLKISLRLKFSQISPPLKFIHRVHWILPIYRREQAKFEGIQRDDRGEFCTACIRLDITIWNLPTSECSLRAPSQRSVRSCKVLELTFLKSRG